MRLLFAFICLAGLLPASQVRALGQGRSDGVESLKKEIELLKRELDLLKRENELLKAENATLKKGGSAKKSDNETDSVTRVTVKNVEYVWQGLTRNGAIVTATVLATSKDGIQVAPKGTMTLVDPEGTKYPGRLVAGARTSLSEGVPVKLSWRFGAKGLGGIDPTKAPSAKITRFTGVSIGRTSGRGDTIEFRNVPAVTSKD